MENTNNYDDILSFVAPRESDSYIKVIGVGGGGCNAVNHMYRQGIVGVNFVVCNTDAQALQQSPVPVKLQLGRTKGLGAGNVPEVAKQAALEKKEEIKELLSDNTHMLFVTAGMGGGTGTGAAPVVAAIAKEIELDDDVKEILVVGIVSTPFFFEGPRRLQQAREGIKELRNYVDAILIINNDNLNTMGGAKMLFKEAMAKADDVLSTAAKGISEIITIHTMINVDFRDVHTVMRNSGVALMGVGKAKGENRAQEAVVLAMDSPLLNDNSIEGAKSILLCVMGSEKLPLMLEEVYTVTDFVRRKVGNEVEVIFGAGADNCEEDYLQVTLVATGFNEKTYDQEHTKVAVIGTDGTVHVNQPSFSTQTNLREEVRDEQPRNRFALEEPRRVVKLSESPVSTTELPVSKTEPQTEFKAELQTNHALDMASSWFSEMVEAPACETASVATPVCEAPAYAPAYAAVNMSAETEAAETAVAAQSEMQFEMEAAAPMTAGLRLVKHENGLQFPNMETQTMVEDAVASPAAPVYAHPAYQQRMDRMRRFKEQLENNGLEYIEKVPAWKRADMELNPSLPSSSSEMGDMMMMPDGRITKNAYLRDNERVD